MREMEIKELLKLMMERKASDLHLKVGRPPLLRISGRIVETEFEKLSPEMTKELAYSILDDKQIETFERIHELDVGYSVPKLSRFRANFFYQRGTIEIVFRAIPFKVPTIDELELPDILKELALKNQGLVIVAGPTGVGKTTTLAAMVEHINANRECHIITIEDPIEYLHRDKKASISQREIGLDSYSYSDALKYVLRQDPDVILIGEMRDLETMRIALRAGEIGRLVLTTLHTMDAPGTIDRIISFFPTEEQSQVRMQLSLLLQGVICQRLVRRANGDGRVAVVEVMTLSPQIAKLIEEGKISKIHDAIASSVVHYKMQTLNQSLVALYLNEVITYEDALSVSPNVDEFKRVLHEFQRGKIKAGEEE